MATGSLTRPMVNPVTLKTLVGKHIQRMRQKAGLSQATLAALMGKTRASVGNLESGIQRVVVDDLYNLGFALKMKPSAFLPELPASK